ncbi:sulfated surface glycoprotein [Tripterygium wilfordii]|uniref:Sulfated surface glycoprotein n=1 Tax=Tripterygium wilfordii TaxID=458696 RepID=A0A7J7CP24_TRIWF|nr:pistil-specific extensin-like protein [Tripterygium wilfordii]KAF5735666.1 sulfated surface glycoprotein [Tripterygium wilfordii]
MEPRRQCSKGFYSLIVCTALHITTLFSPIEARFSVTSIKDLLKNMRESNHLEIKPPLNRMNDELCGAISPVSFPPLESLPPLPQSNNALLCTNTPPIPEPPYGPMPSPNNPLTSPPLGKPNSPPWFSFPPIPSPPKPVRSPPIYQPPPGPPHKQPESGVWCVAKPSVPDPIVQEAMDYACGTGADCKLIQPSGPCFKPNTVVAHASYAFNSYWQKTKNGGGTCDFGGTAMLVTVDPSSNGCPFAYNN